MLFYDNLKRKIYVPKLFFVLRRRDLFCFPVWYVLFFTHTWKQKNKQVKVCVCDRVNVFFFWVVDKRVCKESAVDLLTPQNLWSPIPYIKKKTKKKNEKNTQKINCYEY